MAIIYHQHRGFLLALTFSYLHSPARAAYAFLPLDYRKHIQNRIDVSKPYYALQNEAAILNEQTSKELGFACNVVTETPMGREGGNISTWEAGRHMAIAGSVAAARYLGREGKFYYLALNAKVSRLPNKGDGANEIPASQAIVVAQCIDTSANSCSCEVILETSPTEDLWFLEVEYKVLSFRVFRRYFKDAKDNVLQQMKEAQLKSYSPYKSFIGLTNPVLPILSARNCDDEEPIFNDAVENKVRKSEVESITCVTVLPKPAPEQCLGHFENRPALPVAFTSAFVVDMIAQSIAQFVGAFESELPFKNFKASSDFKYDADADADSFRPPSNARASFSIVCEEFNLSAEELVFAESYEQHLTCKIQYHYPTLHALESMNASKGWSTLLSARSKTTPKFTATVVGTKKTNGSETENDKIVLRSSGIFRMQENVNK